MLVGSIQWFSTPLWEGTFSPFIRFLGPVFALSFGALLGDVLGSFLKRRMGMDKGSRAPVLDQYDFVLGALVLTAVIFPSWVMFHYVLGEAVFGLILIIVITPILHRTVNIIGYKIGKKEVPW